MRALVAVLMIAVVAGLIAAAILLATDAGQDTDLGEFIGDNAKDAVQGFKDFLLENTEGN